MRKRGIVPDEITYSSAIVACGNAGEVRRALGLLKVRGTNEQSGWPSGPDEPPPSSSTVGVYREKQTPTS